MAYGHAVEDVAQKRNGSGGDSKSVRICYTSRISGSRVVIRTKLSADTEIP